MTSSSDNIFYQRALKATEEIEEPAIGLSQSTGRASGISEIGKILIRQNNTLIELCVQLSNQVSQLESRIKSLEAAKQAETLITPELVTKLEKLTINPNERPKPPKGVLRVHRNPYKLLQEELDKANLKK